MVFRTFNNLDGSLPGFRHSGKNSSGLENSAISLVSHRSERSRPRFYHTGRQFRKGEKIAIPKSFQSPFQKYGCRVLPAFWQIRLSECYTFVLYLRDNAMTNGMQYRAEMANTRIVSRLKQVIILVAIIAAGIVISIATESKSDALPKASVLNN